jgi:uncharacterized membrane protein
MRTQSWTTTIDNITYNIEYYSGLIKKKLLVNKVPVKLQSSKTFGITRETTFKLGNKIAILVSIDNDSDIAIDGIYLDSGEQYIKVKYMPYWNFIFLGLVLLIFIFSYDSICSLLFTLTGFYFLIRVSIEPSLKVKQRILLCSFITLSMHLFFWGVLFLLLSIL